jgi:Kef-type K+ transport system membrane component KefB
MTSRRIQVLSCARSASEAGRFPSLMSHLLQLLLLLPIFILSAKLAGAAANRIGQPAVFGEILIGLVLGPTALDILGWPMFADVPSTGDGGAAHAPLIAVIRDLAEVGVILLMFVAGLETDLDEMRRVGRVAFWAAAGGVILPMAGGAATAVFFGLPLLWEGLFIGTILTATSVSISAQTLIELGALKSKEGSTILGAAVIDDVMGIVVLSAVTAFARAAGGVDVASIALILVRMVVFFALGIALGRFFEPVARWADRLGVSHGLLAVVVAVAFLYAWAAERIGSVAAITGSYLAGVFFAGTTLRKRIDAGIHPLTYSIFVPVFFISIGLRANARELGSSTMFTLALVAVAIVTKAVGCAVAARWAGFNARQSLRVGVGMISRGEVGLIVAGYGLAAGLIGQDVFSASVLMVLVTTMITPPLLRLVFPRGPAHPPSVPMEEAIAKTPQKAADHR